MYTAKRGKELYGRTLTGLIVEAIFKFTQKMHK